MGNVVSFESKARSNNSSQAKRNTRSKNNRQRNSERESQLRYDWNVGTYREELRRRESDNKNNNRRNRKRKKRRRRINWKRLFLYIFLLIIIGFGIYVYSKREIIINTVTEKYNEIKEKIDVALKPEEYWTALNDVYSSDDILISVPMGIYYDSEQSNRCAVKVPQNAKIKAECRYRDMKDYMFTIADGTVTAKEAVQNEILEHNLAIRSLEINCEETNTQMKYTVYSLDDGNYKTISTVNPKAEQVGTEEHPAIAFFSNHGLVDYDLYMYYYIDAETTLHICYTGPLSEILNAKELGECIFQMIDDYREAAQTQVEPVKETSEPDSSKMEENKTEEDSQEVTGNTSSEDNTKNTDNEENAEENNTKNKEKEGNIDTTDID